MKFEEVRTVEDAKAWMLANKTVRRELLRTFCKKFNAHVELYDFAVEHGIEIADP